MAVRESRLRGNDGVVGINAHFMDKNYLNRQELFLGF